MMIVDCKFNLGDTVYHKMDADQKARMVVQISVRPSGILYELSNGVSNSWHYEIELSEEKDVLKATNS